MVEKALLLALVALTIVVVASSIADMLVFQAERLQCTFEDAKVCVIDGDMK